MKEQQQTTAIQDYFNNLHFDEAAHKYRVLADDKQLTSVTTYVNKFVEPFKTHQIASQVAKSKQKKGINVDSDYIKRYWAIKGALSREKGNLVHLFASQMPNFDEPQTDLEEQVIEFYANEILDKEEVLATEMIMYFGGLAGTADLITQKEDGTLHLWDYKTTSDFKKSYNKLLAPFQDFRDSALNTYTLQLCLYKWIIESATPYRVSEMTLVALNDGEPYRLVELNDDLVKCVESLFKSKQNGEDTDTQQ